MGQCKITEVKSGNLLLNGDGESGANAWSGTGPIEALSSGECQSAHNGSHLLAVGGICSNETSLGQVYQSIDLSAYQASINSGSAKSELKGWLRNYNGKDIPSIWVDFFILQGDKISQSSVLQHQTSTWTEVLQTLDIAVNTAYANFIFTRTEKIRKR
ncbi:hypothetical protein [Aliikangiella maris]|uniref:Uncharacterized protein n=2 Tax=Aliikangiella maris TaxID=3162458 RepID=A0ABV3MKU6_9GAMM